MFSLLRLFLGLSFARLSPICLHHLRLGYPCLRRTGTAPRGFATHGARPLLGTAPLRDTPRAMATMCSPNQDLWCNPQDHPQDAYFVGAWPLRFLFLKICPLGHLSRVQPTRALEIRFLPSQGFNHGLGLHCSPQAFDTLRAASLWCFALRAGSQWHCPFGLAFAVLDTTRTLPSQLRPSRPQEGLDCPQGFCHQRDWALSGTKYLSGHPQVMPSTPTPNQHCSTPKAFPPRAFLRMLAALGPGPQRLLLQAVCPTGPLTPALANRPGHLCASTVLVANMVQEWPKIIVVPHSCVTTVLDHVRTTMIYVMRRDVSVLQRVQLSSLVLYVPVHNFNCVCV
jgi:hypothetical protein